MTRTRLPPAKTCPVCSTSIGLDRLLCLPHWRLVPVRMQREVLDTWRRFQRRKPSNDGLLLLRDYRRAADAATAYVAAALPDPQQQFTQEQP